MQNKWLLIILARSNPTDEAYMVCPYQSPFAGSKNTFPFWSPLSFIFLLMPIMIIYSSYYYIYNGYDKFIESEKTKEYNE